MMSIFQQYFFGQEEEQFKAYSHQALALTLALTTLALMLERNA